MGRQSGGIRGSFQPRAVIISSPQQIVRSKPTAIEKQQIRADYEAFVKTLPTIQVGNDVSHQKDTRTATGEIVRVQRKFFGEIFSKAKNSANLNEIIQTAKEFEQWIPLLKGHTIEKGKHHNCNFAVYNFHYNNHDWEMKAMINSGHLKAYNLKMIR